jgi:hypothetical protein
MAILKAVEAGVSWLGKDAGFIHRKNCTVFWEDLQMN